MKPMTPISTFGSIYISVWKFDTELYPLFAEKFGEKYEIDKDYANNRTVISSNYSDNLTQEDVQELFLFATEIKVDRFEVITKTIERYI